MATPIQFIREQIANSAIDPSKLDLSSAGITYDYSGVALEASTKSQGDNSTEVATTAYVDTAVNNALPTGGAGIDIDGATGTVAVDIALGSSGLTFSGTGNSRQLIAAISESTPRGLGLNADGYLEIQREVAGALDFDGSGNLQVMVKADAGILRHATDGLYLDLNASFLEVDANDGLQLVDGAVTSIKIATGAVTSTKIANGAVGNTKLASNAVTNSKIGNDAVGVAELAIESHYEEFNANGSTAAFTVSGGGKIEYPEMAQVFKNGQRMSYVTGTPGADEYTIANATVTFGANVTSGAVIQVAYFSAGTVA